MILHLLFLPLALGAISARPQPRQDAPPQVLERTSATDGHVLRTYDVRDLLPAATPGSEALGGLGYVGEPAANQPPAPPSQRAATIEFLSDTIAREVQPTVKPTFWKLRLTPSGTLVLHATPEQHEWTQHLLERNRSKERLVLVESHWIEGPKGSFQRLGLPAGSAASVIAAKDRERLLGLAKEDGRFQLLCAPRLLVQPLATAVAWTGEQIAYVKCFKLERVQPGDVIIADPEVATVQEGLQLEARAALLDEHRLVLDLQASSTAVRRPIPTRSVRIAPDSDLEGTIAEPEIDRKSVAARCTLDAQGCAAFSAPAAGREDRELLVLVAARSVTQAELEALPAERVTSGAQPGGEAIKPR